MSNHGMLYRKVKLFALRRIVLRHEWFRQLLISLVVKVKGVNKKNCSLSLEQVDVLNNVNEQGVFVFKSFLNKEKVETITKKLSKLRCYDRYRKFRGEYVDDFTLETVPAESHTVDFYREDLVKIPEIMNIANDPKILDIVKAFLGVKPVISNVTCWFSQPREDGPKDSQFYHRDKDGIKFIKLFIYLCDVDDTTGPHVYVKSTSVSKGFRKCLRYSDAEVVKAFGEEKVTVLTGNSGDAILEDTFGLHKGMVPTEKSRLILQVQYSISPLVELSYNPLEGGLGDHDPYINQCIAK